MYPGHPPHLFIPQMVGAHVTFDIYLLYGCVEHDKVNLLDIPPDRNGNDIFQGVKRRLMIN